MKLKIGGVLVGYYIVLNLLDFKQVSEGFIFIGMVLDRNVFVMFDLFCKLIVEINFDSLDVVLQIWQFFQVGVDGVVNDIVFFGYVYVCRVVEVGLLWDVFIWEQVSGLL